MSECHKSDVPALRHGELAEDGLLQALGAVYAAAANPAREPEAQQRLAALLNADAVLRLTLDPTAAGNPTRAEAAAKAVPWPPDGSWMQRVARLQAGELLHEGPWLAGMVRRGPECVAIVAVRPPHAPPFEPEATGRLRRLLPHLVQAEEIRARLDRLPEPFDLLRQLPLPWMLTDQAGRCLERNEAFDRFAAAAPVHIATGRLRFADPSLQERWEIALRTTHETAVGRTVQIPCEQARSWKVHLVPLHEAAARDGSHRLILALPQEQEAASLAAETLRQAAGLTHAEIEVLGALLQGLPAKAIASRRGSSVNTIRSQIMAILAKTGRRSQKELLAAFGPSAYASSSFESSFGPDPGSSPPA